MYAYGKDTFSKLYIFAELSYKISIIKSFSSGKRTIYYFVIPMLAVILASGFYSPVC